MENKKLFTVTEVCKILGISKAKAYDLINRKYLMGLDLGGLKIPCAEIDKFIAKYTGYSFKDMDNVTELQSEYIAEAV